VVWFPADGPLNHFTPSGTPTATNDSPTNDADNDYGNYATLSPIDKNSNITLSDGNLIIDGGTAQGYPSFGTQSITEGKYYYEFEFDTLDGTNAGPVFGFCNKDANDFSLDLVNVAPADYYTMRYWIGGTGYRVHNDTSIYQPNNDPTAAAGQLGAVAIDLDAGKGWFLIDDVIMADSGGTQGSIASGTNPCFTFTANTPMLPVGGATTNATGICNFGQTTFTNTPPTGYKALCTANTPTPAIPDPTDHHQVELVNHDGSSTAFTCNWDADVYDTLFIIKNRDSVEKWYWVNGLSGYTKYMVSDTEGAEVSDSNVLSVSGTTITLGSTLANDNYVVECHRAGAAGGASNTDGSITSTVSNNSVTGFSLITYTGTGAAGTIGHGLGATPDFMPVQNTSTGGGAVYHSSVASTHYMRMQSTAASSTEGATTDVIENITGVVLNAFTTGSGGGLTDTDKGDSVGTTYHGINGSSAWQVDWDLGSGNDVAATRYVIWYRADGNGPYWGLHKFYGSNDDITYTLLKNVTTQDQGASESATAYTYNFSNSTSYRYYRLEFVSHNGPYPNEKYLIEVEIYAPGTMWNDTGPTSSLFSVGSNSNTNGSSVTMLAYAWAAVEGYSAFGSYEGNNSADGTFINMNMSPATVNLKGFDTTAGWQHYPRILSSNPTGSYEIWNETTPYDNTSNEIDILSNGVKMRDSGTDPNKAETYVYMAWGGTPFGGSGVAQAKAR
jgi:hypothetical protein